VLATVGDGDVLVCIIILMASGAIAALGFITIKAMGAKFGPAIIIRTAGLSPLIPIIPVATVGWLGTFASAGDGKPAMRVGETAGAVTGAASGAAGLLS
jgi:hypothetical protein